MSREVWLTVVTVVRNDAAGLAATSDSVAAQDLTGVRHLVIDGASTDSTRDILAGIATRASTRVVSEPDRGIYDAMNKGWRLAGEGMAPSGYVQYLNAGDVYATAEELAWVRRRIAANPAWLRTRVRFIDDAGAQTRPVGNSRIDDRFWWGWQTTLHQGAFMTRELLAAMSGFDDGMKVQGDFDLMLRVLESGTRPLVDDRVTVDVDASGVSTQLWRTGFREMHHSRSRGRAVPRRVVSRLDLAAHIGVVGGKRVARRSLEALLGPERVSRLRS